MAAVSLDNPVFKAFVTYAVIVVVKMMLMSFATAFSRIKNKVTVSAYGCTHCPTDPSPTSPHPGVIDV